MKTSLILVSSSKAGLILFNTLILFHFAVYKFVMNIFMATTKIFCHKKLFAREIFTELGCKNGGIKAQV